MNSPFEEIVKQVRRTKKSKEWEDKDGMMRCSNINIIPRKVLKNWLFSYLKGATISSIAKSTPYSYVRVKKGFNAAVPILNQAESKFEKVPKAVSVMWKIINRK